MRLLAGVGSSESNQVQTAYNAFHQFASGIWGDITSKVVLLPFADGQFTRQQLWIRNLKEFDKKAKDWAHLKIYLDPNFGNPYILNKPGKTGSKTYKTRMRFGMDTAPPILMQELRSVLSSEPRAGVFPTPIQVSDMVRLGFLPLLPQELAIGPYCKDLMRLCDFQYPIGLMQEWVNNPRFFSAKFTGSSRGLLCWHVFVPKAFAREADLILAANLDLRKPSCAPFQAPTHYTRDWQAAKDELVLGKQCPQLQSLIETMRERTRATRVLTAIYRIPIELPGMLTSAATENFGRLTLLRLLLAVIVTGAQAKKAEDAEPKKPPTKALDVLSDSESSGDDDDDDSPPTFEWTTQKVFGCFHSKTCGGQEKVPPHGTQVSRGRRCLDRPACSDGPLQRQTKPSVRHDLTSRGRWMLFCGGSPALSSPCDERARQPAVLSPVSPWRVVVPQFYSSNQELVSYRPRLPESQASC
ncbi:unnamed protein product [Cylindrotheca closterium]|uniref:Uncharacterized protein n=1 Tax=Cylindrotheca closterium TaxID=2856 RepID=A0AAD2FDE8_9STRA|nr:unnamed protein product [Cylindrotheca closterium]